MPPNKPTIKILRPHLIERGYSFAGRALPRDSGDGGVKDWNLWLCIERVEALEKFILLDAIEGRSSLWRVWKLRFDIRWNVCEFRRYVFGILHLSPLLRRYCPAVRSDIASMRCEHPGKASTSKKMSYIRFVTCGLLGCRIYLNSDLVRRARNRAGELGCLLVSSRILPFLLRLFTFFR